MWVKPYEHSLYPPECRQLPDFRNPVIDFQNVSLQYMCKITSVSSVSVNPWTMTTADMKQNTAPIPALWIQVFIEANWRKICVSKLCCHFFHVTAWRCLTLSHNFNQHCDIVSWTHLSKLLKNFNRNTINSLTKMHIWRFCLKMDHFCSVSIW